MHMQLRSFETEASCKSCFFWLSPMVVYFMTYFFIFNWEFTFSRILIKKKNEVFVHSPVSLQYTLLARVSVQSHLTLCDFMVCVAHGVPLFMGFFRQEYWDGLPFAPPGDLPDLGIEATFLVSLTGSFLTNSTTWASLLIFSYTDSISKYSAESLEVAHWSPLYKFLFSFLWLTFPHCLGCVHFYLTCWPGAGL